MTSFNPNTKRFSLANALFLAEASSLAYRDGQDVIKHVKDKWKMETCFFFDKDDTQCFIAADKTRVILSFRGTESLEDWQTDLQAKFLKAYSMGRVHSGFKKALNHVWKDITPIINDLVNPFCTLWICGHSLGGALATLAADRLSDDGININGIYTFGQPRVGDEDFALHYDSKLKRRTFRFVNDEDVVTRVPPRIMGYRHIGTIRLFDHKGDLHIDNINWKRWLSISEGVTKRSDDRFSELKHQYPDGIDDHSMMYYLKHLQKNYKQQENKNTFVGYINS